MQLPYRTLAVLTLTFFLLPPGQAAQSQEMPKLYGFCMEIHDSEKRTIPQQAEMLKELGFDGVGYPLWVDESLEKNLKTLDDAGLEVYQLYTRVNLAENVPAFDPAVLDAIRKLKGRPTTVTVLISGCAPGDVSGESKAADALRKLGDAAAEADVRISIYHHTGDWTESLLFALDVVKRLNHPRVGVNFNLCHWLMIDGDKDYRVVLRENADRIFAVTINGAAIGSKTWTNGLIQPLDAGDFDNRGLLATLREIGYDGPVGLMCYGIPGDAREHLARSMGVWNKWKEER